MLDIKRCISFLTICIKEFIELRDNWICRFSLAFGTWFWLLFDTKIMEKKNEMKKSLEKRNYTWTRFFRAVRLCSQQDLRGDWVKKSFLGSK